MYVVVKLMSDGPDLFVKVLEGELVSWGTASIERATIFQSLKKAVDFVEENGVSDVEYLGLTLSLVTSSDLVAIKARSPFERLVASKGLTEEQMALIAREYKARKNG